MPKGFAAQAEWTSVLATNQRFADVPKSNASYFNVHTNPLEIC